MKNILALVFTFISSIGFSQEKVIFNDENVVLRDVQSYQSVVVSGPFKVYYSTDPSTQVAVSAKDSDARDLIVTKVSGGKLYISLEGSGFRRWNINKEFKVYITAPKLSGLSLSGAVNFVVVDELSSTNLSLNLSGASNFSGKVECNEINANLAGASDAKVSGLAQKITLVSSGASGFKGFDFKVNEADLDATGASTIKIHVIESLKAKASGASSIQYKGVPRLYNQSSIGASSIRKID